MSSSKNHEKGGLEKSKFSTVISHGISVRIEHGSFDDFEFIDMLDELNEGNSLKVPKLLKKMLGKKSKKILDKLRNKDGIVPVSVATDFLLDIINQINPNSSRSQHSTQNTEVI